MATLDEAKDDDYEPIWEGWKEPYDDETRPWRLLIQPAEGCAADDQPRSTERADAIAELKELFRSAPGAYPGREPDEAE